MLDPNPALIPTPTLIMTNPSPSPTPDQAAVLDLDAFADGNAECCLSKPPAAEVLALLNLT